MLRGFMDHWVPTAPELSRFWCSDFAACRAMIADLLEDLALTNWTFYTKWFTNGVKSDLPFLRNDPQASNVRTDNDWGRQLIAWLHEQGLSVGAMLQCYGFEKEPWGDAPALGDWDTGALSGTGRPDVIADFTSEVYRERLAQMLREQLSLFPDLDYVFLEFEGVSGDMAQHAYRTWRQERDLPPPEEVTWAEEQRDYCGRAGLDLGFFFSAQALEMFRHYMRLNLETARRVAGELGHPAQLGVVYYAAHYETFVMPHALPAEDFWLLPWCYFGWVEEGPQRQRTREAVLRHMAEQIGAGREVLYIGDASISPWDLESMAVTMDFCESSGARGYLGMGNPAPDPGLTWLEVEPRHLQAAREFFRSRWPRSPA